MLTEDQIVQIYFLSREGVAIKVIAQQLEVKYAAVGWAISNLKKIKSGKVKSRGTYQNAVTKIKQIEEARKNGSIIPYQDKTLEQQKQQQDTFDLSILNKLEDILKEHQMMKEKLTRLAKLFPSLV